MVVLASQVRKSGWALFEFVMEDHIPGMDRWAHLALVGEAICLLVVLGRVVVQLHVSVTTEPVDRGTDEHSLLSTYLLLKYGPKTTTVHRLA